MVEAVFVDSRIDDGSSLQGYSKRMHKIHRSGDTKLKADRFVEGCLSDDVVSCVVKEVLAGEKMTNTKLRKVLLR